jgi:hypothetical protein
MIGKTKAIFRFFPALVATVLSSMDLRAETTAVLPPGVRTFLIRRVQADVPGLYGMDSNYHSFRVQERLDGHRIATAYKPAAEMLKEVGAIDPEAAKSIDFGSIDLNPQIQVQVDALAFGWGFSHDTMILAVAPYWRAKTDMSRSSFATSNSLKNAADRLEKIASKTQDPERARIISQILSRLPTVTGANLQDVLVSQYGYKPLGSWSGEGFGDTTLFVHNRYYMSKFVRLAGRVGEVFPTGRKDDPDNLVDIPFGEGVPGTFVESLNDFYPLPGVYNDWLILSLGARYQYNWETVRNFRLVQDSSFPLTSEKESIRYKPGDRWLGRAGADVKLASPLRAYSSFTFERIERDQIIGKRSGYDYNNLMNATDAEIQTVEAGLKFSTVAWYKAGRFTLPLEACASYSRVVRGKNTELISLGYAELALYF